MTIYQNEFKPTWLMVKHHEVSGLKYLCKTTKSDPDKYKGSGIHWKRHIKKHGIQYVSNLWYCLFTDKEELTKFALMCSEQWDIVDSGEWANKKPENGLDGSPVGIKYTAEHRANISKSLKGRISAKFTDEHRANLSKAIKGKPRPSILEQQRINMSKAHTNVPLSKEHRDKIVAGSVLSKTYKIFFPINGTNKPDHTKSKWVIIKSMRDFVRNYNLENPLNKLSQSHMTSIANGNRKHHKGFVTELQSG